ncbi:hypothetical protein BDB00DRAFT_870300 [Zychaea mexicana]|uniref:uncharacterized protein n=1 Tax=Zychaea mexicana TaxID=64656 RepID=UPI0022FEC532|nr:uncharacterized protein BDB00DRAFT_870300 [Zychaea mexicana]KAI9495440.1 hypothetical protein BDB00DRAFT_870300 [Zychaea mexicana]
MHGNVYLRDYLPPTTRWRRQQVAWLVATNDKPTDIALDTQHTQQAREIARIKPTYFVLRRSTNSTVIGFFGGNPSRTNTNIAKQAAYPIIAVIIESSNTDNRSSYP